MTDRADFIAIYGRKPTAPQLRAFTKMMGLIKSQRLQTGVPLR